MSSAVSMQRTLRKSDLCKLLTIARVRGKPEVILKEDVLLFGDLFLFLVNR